MSSCKLKIVFNYRLRNLFAFKDRIPTNMKTAVIYKFTCSDCNVTYIGKTDRYFHVRYCEHLEISPYTNKDLKYNKRSATSVREHLRDYKHKASPNNFKIIGTLESGIGGGGGGGGVGVGVWGCEESGYTIIISKFVVQLIYIFQ